MGGPPTTSLIASFLVSCPSPRKEKSHNQYNASSCLRPSLHGIPHRSLPLLHFPPDHPSLVSPRSPARVRPVLLVLPETSGGPIAGSLAPRRHSSLARKLFLILALQCPLQRLGTRSAPTPCPPSSLSRSTGLFARIPKTESRQDDQKSLTSSLGPVLLSPMCVRHSQSVAFLLFPLPSYAVDILQSSH
jgi:hypothetical protein